MIKSITDIDSAFTLMLQLRPHISLDQFRTIYQAAHKADEYTLYGYFTNESSKSNQLVGLMGIRTLFDYVHGKHLYIDDLVVDEKFRSSGIGKKLLEFSEELARKENCTGLRLCTGVDNKDGMRFYEREKWNQRAVVYKKKLT